MRSDWVLPVCSGKERLRVDGVKAHSTQKPEALLYRVLTASSRPGDVVLDPFFGTGTTGAVAKRLGRRWIGIERDPDYAALAGARIEQVMEGSGDWLESQDDRRRKPRLPFGRLLEEGLLVAGESLFFDADRKRSAVVLSDGALQAGPVMGSIHMVGRHFAGGSPCNGWEHWFFETQAGELRPIDDLRDEIRGSTDATEA
jgi:modification methylase